MDKKVRVFQHCYLASHSAAFFQLNRSKSRKSAVQDSRIFPVAIGFASLFCSDFELEDPWRSNCQDDNLLV